MRVTVCKFRRKQTAEWEYGLMLDDDKGIVDKNYQIVPAPIWDYDLHPYEGCVDFNLRKPIE